jgi:hypothetical protein
MQHTMRGRTERLVTTAEHERERRGRAGQRVEAGAPRHPAESHHDLNIGIRLIQEKVGSGRAIVIGIGGQRYPASFVPIDLQNGVARLAVWIAQPDSHGSLGDATQRIPETQFSVGEAQQSTSLIRLCRRPRATVSDGWLRTRQPASRLTPERGSKHRLW